MRAKQRVPLIAWVGATLAAWTFASLAMSHSADWSLSARASSSAPRSFPMASVSATPQTPQTALPPPPPPPPLLRALVVEPLTVDAAAPERAVDYSKRPYDAIRGLNVSALRLCRPSQKKLYCEGDHECVGPCHHVNYNISYGYIDFSFTKAAIAKFFRERAQRRDQLAEVLRQRDVASGPHGGELMVVTFNIGYGYVFANWYCSLLANGVDLDNVKRHLLVVATDEDARKFASSLGFFTFDTSFLTEWTNLRISSSAASKFATGPHSLLNLVSKFGIIVDLVNMGINTTIMDIDIVWAGNPLPFIREECDRQNCDAIFMDDGRPFGSAVDAEIFERKHHVVTDPLFRPPLVRTGHSHNKYPYLNTGFFRVTQSARMAKFLHTLIGASFLQQWKGTDQLVWNTVMYHRDFADYQWARLPFRRFVPGGTLHLNRHLVPFPQAPELLAIHPSDAARHQDKIIKLIRIRHWYYSKSTCPAYEPCLKTPKCMPKNLEEEIANATIKAKAQLENGADVVFAAAAPLGAKRQHLTV